MRVIIQDQYQNLSQWAANHVVQRIRQHQEHSSRPFVLGLPTGSTPLGMYQALIRHCQEGRVSFANVVTFNMDEYVGLAPEHPQSYRSFMDDNLFSHIDIKKENTHVLWGQAPDLEAECAAYESAIAHAGGIDLFLGGIGADGHIAFNEPTSSLNSRTRIKTLTEETRLVNARFFGGDVSQVPHMALTVGVGTVMDAREVLILVSGHTKARALQKVVEEGVNHLWTVSMLQMHPKGIIVCTDDACSELKVGTFRYFREIEKDHLDPQTLLRAWVK